MDREKTTIPFLAILLCLVAITLLVINCGKYVLGKGAADMVQEINNEYEKTHVQLPADGLVVSKSYVAQHTDNTYGLFYSNSTTYPESYIITLQRTYKGKKITGDYTATEDEYKAAKKGAMFRDPVGSNIWYDLSNAS